MVRRSLGVALWGVVGLLAGVLGALSALIGTGAGRNLVARAAEGALRQVFTGTIEIGDVGGTLLTGLTLSDVRLFDPDTTLVAWLPRADLSYNPLEFAAGRVVLFELDLRQPVFNIVQHPSGRLNAEELLRLGGPDTAQAPRGPAARRGGPHHRRGRLARRRPGAGAAPRLRAPGPGPRPLAARHVAVRSRGACRLRHSLGLPVHRLPLPRRGGAAWGRRIALSRQPCAGGPARSAHVRLRRRHGHGPAHRAQRGRFRARRPAGDRPRGARLRSRVRPPLPRQAAPRGPPQRPHRGRGSDWRAALGDGLGVSRLPRAGLAAVHGARARRGGSVARRGSGLPVLRGGRGGDRPGDGAAARAGRPAAGHARRCPHAHGPARPRAGQPHAAAPAAGASPVRSRELDLSRWLAAGAGPPSRLSATLSGTVGADSGAPPAGLVTAALAPSLFVGVGLDSGGARLRFADRRVYVDSLRLSQPGLITTGSGVLGWARPARGALSLDLDADSLTSVDSRIVWGAARAPGRGPGGSGGGGGGGGGGRGR